MYRAHISLVRSDSGLKKVADERKMHEVTKKAFGSCRTGISRRLGGLASRSGTLHDRKPHCLRSRTLTCLARQAIMQALPSCTAGSYVRARGLRIMPSVATPREQVVYFFVRRHVMEVSGLLCGYHAEVLVQTRNFRRTKKSQWRLRRCLCLFEVFDLFRI